MDATRRLMDLLGEHGPRLHRLFVRLTLRGDAADDLLQELFLKLREANGFAKADDPVAFAVRVAVNLAFDWRRRQARRGARPLGGSEPAPPADPLAGLIEREEMEQVLAALAGLPEGARLAIVLRHLERRGAEEAALLMGKTAHQVRALCAKGLALLRERLGVLPREVSDG